VPPLQSTLNQPPGESAVTARDPQRFINRELSWLEFNARVLALAEERDRPLLERVKFLAIVARNLDEFFQIRVALLRAEHQTGIDGRAPDGMSTEDQLAAIRTRVLELVSREEAVFAKDLRPALAAAGVRICDWAELEPADRDHLSRVFDERVFPVLTPLAVDPSHPFPYVSNLSFNLAVLLRDPATGSVRFARMKIPGLLDRFVRLPDGERFVPIEQLISAHLDRLFPGMGIESHCEFRVTRDADLDIEEDEADDLLVAIESGLRRRRRASDAVRLEVDAGMPAHTRALLLEELELDPDDLYVREGLLDLGALWQLYRLDRPDLKERVWIPRSEPHFAGFGADPLQSDVFARLREGDVLVHHPYDSFERSVLTFLSQAAADPDVLAIKHTIYRTSGAENPIGSTLMRAAEAGKQVVTLVELKARFDEQTNIEWARKLEQAGVHVVYGLVGLKTHAKIALVVRQEREGIRRYCHVGTGNYNPVTARSYEDVGLFSADPDVGADLSELFNHLTGCSHETTYRKLLVAPVGLRSGLADLIRHEAEQPDGRIVIKVNNLQDPKVIDALYEAAAAGTEIDLIVRSICCLRPGVPGLSERIRVRSIVGRFLEHSRVFRFGSPARGVRWFIGSADLMPRNLDRRVEVLAPVEDPALQARLEQTLDLLLADDVGAWELVDARWRKIPTTRDVSAQAELQRFAQERIRGD
jgi:polyphosphate kinase